MPTRTYRRYRHAVRFLESVLTLESARRFSKLDTAAPGGAVGLKRCRRLLSLLGNPQNSLRFVHVAGTSGKGSVAHLVHRILHESGIRVGTYMSPHVTTTLERIWVGPGFIPPETFADCVDTLKPVVEAEYRDGPYGVPSYHELVMAVALLAFQRLECDLAIMEVGIGGRLDSTNIIPTPEVAVITDVGLDHTDLLGQDIRTIARDKAGIIKPGTTVFTGARRPSALREILEVGKRHEVAVHALGEQIVLRENADLLEISTPDGQIAGLRVSAPGAHQTRNAALAVATALHLRQHGFAIDDGAFRSGLEAAFLPGRFEEIRLEHGRVLVLDIAHNADKVAAAVRTWTARHGTDGSAVLSIAGNKDRTGILAALRKGFRNVAVTRPLSSHRSMTSPLLLAQEASPLFDHLVFRLDPWDALTAATEMGSGNVLVTGSTYLVSEIRERFEDEETAVRRGRPAPITGTVLIDRVR